MKNIDKGMVSVIIPIYNVEQYIEKCIDSIAGQTYRNIEVICVNDGSPDNSGYICDQYACKDKRIRVIHIQNGGVSNARNMGIEAATGEYIMFVDGDDYLAKDCIEYFVSLMHEFSADIVYSENYYTYEGEQQKRRDCRKNLSGEEAAVMQLCYRTNIGVWNKLFKRQVLKDIRFITSQRIGEGFNFNVSAFQKARRIAVGERKVYYYRQNNESSATKKFSEQKWVNGLQSIEDIKDHMIIQTKEMYHAWLFAKWRTYVDIFIMMELAVLDRRGRLMYQESKKYAKNHAFCAFKTKASWKEKISALFIRFSPKMILVKIKLRRIILAVLKRNKK